MCDARPWGCAGGVLRGLCAGRPMMAVLGVWLLRDAEPGPTQPDGCRACRVTLNEDKVEFLMHKCTQAAAHGAAAAAAPAAAAAAPAAAAAAAS